MINKEWLFESTLKTLNSCWPLFNTSVPIVFAHRQISIKLQQLSLIIREKLTLKKLNLVSVTNHGTVVKKSDKWNKFTDCKVCLDEWVPIFNFCRLLKQDSAVVHRQDHFFSMLKQKKHTFQHFNSFFFFYNKKTI